ncbi:hypothetical protein FOZ62_018566, partial [Perkinsus olseni]
AHASAHRNCWVSRIPPLVLPPPLPQPRSITTKLRQALLIRGMLPVMAPRGCSPVAGRTPRSGGPLRTRVESRSLGVQAAYR